MNGCPSIFHLIMALTSSALSLVLGVPFAGVPLDVFARQGEVR